MFRSSVGAYRSCCTSGKRVARKTLIAQWRGYIPEAAKPICGTAHNVVAPEMLYISGSNGVQFDDRAQALRGNADVISAIERATVE